MAEKKATSVVEEDVDAEELANGCALCGSAESLMRCSGCREVTYCSKAHQVADWKAHKSYCISIRVERKREEQERKERLAPANNKTEEEKAKEKAKLEKLVDTMEQVIEEGGGVAAKPMRFLPAAQCSACGIHARGPELDYVHALNNMAGKHRIDLPLDDESDIEDYLGYGDEWEAAEAKAGGRFAVLGNGLRPQPACLLKRCAGPLGLGLLCKGDVRVGKEAGSDSEVVVAFSGEEDFRYTVEKEVKVDERLTLLAGSSVDAFGCMHGPLTYLGVEFGKAGGVHYNGCAFLTDGTAGTKDNKYYKEACVAHMTKEASA